MKSLQTYLGEYLERLGFLLIRLGQWCPDDTPPGESAHSRGRIRQVEVRNWRKSNTGRLSEIHLD